MAQTSFARSLRSPVATTVFTIVFGLSGLALAGSHTPDVPPPPEGASVHAGAHPAFDEGTHGAEVSALAASTGESGWRKGVVISDLASGGASQAGDHGPHAGTPEGPGSDEGEHQGGRPDDVPNHDPGDVPSNPGQPGSVGDGSSSEHGGSEGSANASEGSSNSSDGSSNSGSGSSNSGGGSTNSGNGSTNSGPGSSNSGDGSTNSGDGWSNSGSSSGGSGSH